MRENILPFQNTLCSSAHLYISSGKFPMQNMNTVNIICGTLWEKWQKLYFSNEQPSLGLQAAGDTVL